MGNAIGKLFILALMLFLMSLFGGKKDSNTTLPAIQPESQTTSSHQQWQSVAAYADRLSAKANDAEQYFR